MFTKALPEFRRGFFCARQKESIAEGLEFL
jgi:hypothetical protein